LSQGDVEARRFSSPFRHAFQFDTPLCK
jgi:hypothetical protein